MLTEKQQEIFDDFLDAIEQKQELFLSSHERRMGKTYTLNELAFTLQALGYIVFVLTPFKNQEYFAHRFINYLRDLRGINRNKIVIIVDEIRFWNNKNQETQEILEFCSNCKIPVIGYVNYYKNNWISNEIKFKREYSCEWIK